MNPLESRDDLQNTMQEASYLSLSAMAERTDKHRSSSEGLSFLSLLNAAITFNHMYPKSSHFNSADATESFRSLDELFCKGDTAAPFQAYTKFIRISYPYIAQAELEQAFQDVLDAHKGGTISQRTDECPEHPVLVYLGVATGILLSQEHTHHETIAKELFESSQKVLCRVFDRSNDLAMVMCLTAITIYSVLTDMGGSTWHILGLAMSRCIACGMHTAKVSDPDSDDLGPRKHARAFWSLYLLDTHVSSVLDRPFCLDDSDIIMSPPSTPANLPAMDDWCHIVDQARIIRSMRRLERRDVLCDFINLQHWYESSVRRHSLDKFRNVQLYAASLVELFKCSAVTANPNCKMIVREAEKIFANYLALAEDQLVSRISMPDSLSVLQIFAIGIIMCRLQSLGQSTQQQTAYQAINILTLLSIRYSFARGLRDILMECLMTIVGAERQEPSTRLRSLVAKSEIFISGQVQAIIFHEKML